jgi:two-component system CheB/CheR fusion protein
MNAPEKAGEQFEALLNYLHSTRGFDFTGYKRSTLIRRVSNRLHALQVGDFGEYLDYLQVHPDEFAILFNTILINVTSFFRDKPAWDFLSSEVIPRILAKKETDEAMRIWSAGCASGEEAYSLAMVLAEFLGLDAFRRRVKIYATDVDEEALAQARLASYRPEDVQPVPEELREKYFFQQNGRFIFNSEMRRSIIFGRHDLVQDAPISRLDLLVCRNTLMYFNSETQGNILLRFHFAMNDYGYLYMGKAEMLLTHANLFMPMDLKYRFFSKVPKAETRDRLLALYQVGDEQAANRLGRQLSLRDIAFDVSPEAQLVVDVNGTLVMANEKARSLFALAASDLGRPLQDLEICYRPLELRPLIDQVVAEHRTLTVPNVDRASIDGLYNFMNVHIIPLSDSGGTLIGVNIVFVDITNSKRLEGQLQNSMAELETAYEELQSTNEELETTNEELQSTIEELETTNEELQSTNEELETMNEELQSTNEELETTNDEMHLRTEDLNDAKAFLETILSNMNIGVIVLDQEFHIMTWNRHDEELWGLRQDEVVGQSLLKLDIGLPVNQLKASIHAIFDGNADIRKTDIDAVNRRGKSIQCRIICTPLSGLGMKRRGVVLLIDEIDEKAKPAEGS